MRLMFLLLLTLAFAPDLAALRGTLDAGGDRASQELADAALQNVGEACAKTADGLSLRHARAVKDAAENAVRAYDPHLRGLVLGHIGLNPDGTKRAFATMAEFEALRVLPVENLNDFQRAAMHAIRAGVIKPVAGTHVAKVVPLSSRFAPGSNGPIEIPGAMSYLQNGHAGFGGFFMRQTDIPTPPASAMNRIRNDYDGSSLMPGDGYAVMETNLTQTMADATRTPVNAVPPGGLNSEYVQVDAGLPCTGNGLAGSVDGHLTPEWKIPRCTADVEVTTLSFKNADGTPNAITIGDITTDRWVLRVDPTDTTRTRWFPLPPTP